MKALLLAGLSVVGIAGSCSKPEMPIPSEHATWSASEFRDIDLSRVSSQYKVASAEQIQEATDWALQQSYRMAPDKPGQTRHDLRSRIQAQDLSSGQAKESDLVHYDGSDVVVIALEGTGGFHARKAPVIQAAAAKLRKQGLRVDGDRASLSVSVSNALEKHEGRDPGWSGLSRGPLESLIRSPELSERVQWLSFPSEELEVMSGLEAFKDPNFSELLAESYDSYRGQTPGIEGALKAIRDIQTQAQKQGKSPKFVLISHSSGGRSLIKLMEKAKSIKDPQGAPLSFSATLTIDPVREAHEAFLEGGRELINKGTEHNLNRIRRSLNLREKKVWPPLVRSRSQPESLYAPSNTQKFLNFFQRQDTQGLKIRPLVGIQGSPVAGALNREIVDVGSAGHGEIALHPGIRQAFLEEIGQALEPR